MRLKIEDFSYHSGAPEWSDSPRLPAYRINGSGFGDKRGTVEIERNGKSATQRIVSWSDRLIYIDAAQFRWSVFDTELFVTTSDGRRSRPFDLKQPGNPYDNYTPPTFGAEPFRLAA